MPTPPFLYIVCQVGAESALKQELSRQWPGIRLAFSRPGFVTFKLPPDLPFAEDTDLRSVFARTWGFSLGKLQGTDQEQLAAEVWQLAGERRFQHLHVWQRDSALPGHRDFEPGLTELAQSVGERIAAQRPDAATSKALPVNLVARADDLVLDCVLVEPDQWWIGYHRASSLPTRWPGGVPKLEMPAHAVSRAYLKMGEALLWSGLPLAPGERCVEIGSSPGGSCQTLLDRGLIVVGIDPAIMHESVLAHPNFTHLRARGADLKRREFRGIKWLMVDSNVAPQHTLDTVEHIVTNRQVQVRGLLLTLKLLEWKLADEIPDYLARIRSWGYQYVRARQLAFNRQEICVAALRSRSLRRAAPGKHARHTKPAADEREQDGL
jgi:23S rRNA (cytidine2498-2'-O)-methyltransferase